MGKNYAVANEVNDLTCMIIFYRVLSLIFESTLIHSKFILLL
jgi:hypothetical protein